MPARFPDDCPEGFLSHYFVVAGDTMSLIASYFGIATEELIAVNTHIGDPDVLRPGDVLCVPGFRKPTQCPPGFQGRYEVVEGDTMFSIAQKFNIRMEELAAANSHIPNPAYIFPFDVLCVPDTTG